MNIKLYSAIGSNACERVLWALDYKNIDFILIDAEPMMGTREYQKISPFAFVPAIDIDGHIITESLPIIELVDELFPDKPLLPKDVFERANVRQICEYINATIHPAQNRSILKFLRPDLLEDEKADLRANWIFKKLMELMPSIWKHGKFVAGHEFTIADIFVAVIYSKGLSHGMSDISQYDDHMDMMEGFF